MKAKSWKKFVKDDPSKKERSSASSPDFFSDEEVNEQSLDDPLQLVLKQNPHLSELVKEREALEQRMANLTGQPVGGQAGDRPFQYAQIPSISEKKEMEKKRQAQRQKEKEILQRRKELGGISGKKNTTVGNLNLPASNLTPLTPSATPSGTNLTPTSPAEEEEKKKKERFDFDRSVKKLNSKRFNFEKSVEELDKKRFSYDKESARRKKEKEDKQDAISSTKKEGPFKTARKTKGRKLNEDTTVGGAFGLNKKKDEYDRFIDKYENKSVDEWLIKDEKKRKKLKKTAGDLKAFGAEFQRKKKQLDQFNELASDERFSGAFDDGLKDKLSTASAITDKINRPFDAIKENKTVQKFKDGWDTAKKKRLDANKVKSKYQTAADKLLKVDVGSFGDMQLKLDQRKAKSLLEKKKQKKEQERKNKRKNERKKEKEREKKEEERRERKRAERKQQKKEKH